VHCEPRIAVVPPHARSAGPQITRLASMAGIQLDEAQQLVADATSGVDRDGHWSAFESVIFAPRQNLKTEFAIARILAGLYLFKEDLIVYSAHQVKTTTKTFRRLKRAIDKSPQLGARIARVSNRIGAERIELATGQAIECVARSTSSGRGFTGDLIIADEAQELDGDQLAAILPMLSTVPNPSVLYMLSLGNEQSSHVGRLRKRALDGDPGVCWVEWSMADDDDIADRRVWAACNPAYPARISMAYMEKEFAALGPDRFARERLGKSEWPSGEPGCWEVFSEADWLAATMDEDGRPWPPFDLSSAAAPAAAAPAPRPFDPFLEWGPSGIPPWVRTG